MFVLRAGTSSRNNLTINTVGHGKPEGESGDVESRETGVSERHGCQLREEVAWVLQLLNAQPAQERMETVLVSLCFEQEVFGGPLISLSAWGDHDLREMC